LQLSGLATSLPPTSLAYENELMNNIWLKRNKTNLKSTIIAIDRHLAISVIYKL